MKTFTMYTPETNFVSFFNSAFEELTSLTPNSPKANIVETGTTAILSLQVPGYSKKDISISISSSIQGNSMTISSLDLSDADGDIDKALKNKKTFLLNEFNTSKTPWKRTFKFDEKYSLEKAKANVENGILTVTIPRENKTTLKMNISVN